MTFIDTVLSLPFIDVPAPEAPPGAEKALVAVSWLGWVAAVAGIIGVMVVGIMMMISHRNGTASEEHVKRLTWVIIGLIIVSAAGALVGVFLG